jgi:kinesin light chain
MSQEDILQSTKTVIQGLEALKNEHGKILENILETMQTSTIDKNKIEEKAGLLRKSMDMIELGKFYFKDNNKIIRIFSS